MTAASVVKIFFNVRCEIIKQSYIAPLTGHFVPETIHPGIMSPRLFVPIL